VVVICGCAGIIFVCLCAVWLPLVLPIGTPDLVCLVIFLVVVLQSGSTEFMLSVSIPRTIALFLMAVQLGSLTWCWSP
jgi:hypothetical protein